MADQSTLKHKAPTEVSTPEQPGLKTIHLRTGVINPQAGP